MTLSVGPFERQRGFQRSFSTSREFRPKVLRFHPFTSSSIMRFAIGAFALLALSGGVSAQCDGTCQCEIDSCFEVLAGDLPFMKQPSIEDCRDFLWEHSTWGSSTLTVTNFVTNGVVTETVSETEINTVTEGTTTLEIITATVTETLTTTTGAGSFTGDPTTTVKAPLRRRRRKRQAKSIPASAAVCGGSVGYSSACTCIGVSAEGTRWTQVPTVTTTITETIASTETAAVTGTIVTTEVGDFAAATETSTLEKTATEQVILPLYTSFVIQLTQDTVNGGSKGYFLKYEADPANSNRRRLMFTQDVEEATLYKTDGSGVISTETGGLGFARDDTATGPGIWQESASGKSGWLDYTCKIDENRLVSCNSPPTFLALDPNDGRKLRAYTYLNNLIPQGCVGPLILAAVPPRFQGLAPPAAISAVIRSRNGNNGIYSGWYIGQEDQQSQPFPRVRFFQSISDATTFTVDPVNGNIFGPNNAPFSAATPPNSGNPTPFLIGGYDATRRIHHLRADLPSTNILLWFPPTYMWLGAVRVDGSNPTGIPFFRMHLDSTMLSDEVGPLTFDIVPV
ncbi:hypothetical protein TWF191_002476 [Orbilia oligospora]|uniref:Uncharacterized protein n=1 Tax=Orbilia oligospora TaxID=2813651 RepID=A0A7C8UXA2_ORBOL|nr:hypothetical protein TWF191_002476 [Orbilia oligospora]